MPKIIAQNSQHKTDHDIRQDATQLDQNNPEPRTPTRLDLRSPAQLNLQSRFGWCRETVKKQGNQFIHPYSLIHTNPFSHKQRIYNCFLLLSLLENHSRVLSQTSTHNSSRIATRSISQSLNMQVFKKTFQFLGMNGANSFILQEQLKQLEVHPEINTILDQFKNRTLTPARGAEILHQNIDIENKHSKEAIPYTHKIPAELSGLRHTLFMGKNGQLYELYPYYELDNAHDANFIGKAHHHDFKPQHQARKTTENSSIWQATLGHGSTAKVIPALDIGNNQLVAVKKYVNTHEFHLDYQDLKQALDLIPPDLRHHFLLPVTCYSGKGKKAILQNENIEKGYTVFPLGTGNNGLAQMSKNTHLRNAGKQSLYEESCYRLAAIFIEKTLAFEMMKAIFLDFKPSNLVGDKIVDFGSLSALQLPFEITMHSYPYTMPHLFRDNLTIAQLETSNRYNLGAIIFLGMTAITATSPKLDPLLQLPENTLLNQRQSIQDPARGYALRGFPSESLSDIPDRLNANSSRYFTPFEKEMLKLAKQLMAEDRNQASAKTLDLKARFEAIGKLRQSQTQIRHNTAEIKK